MENNCPIYPEKEWRFKLRKYFMPYSRKMKWLPTKLQLSTSFYIFDSVPAAQFPCTSTNSMRYMVPPSNKKYQVTLSINVRIAGKNQLGVIWWEVLREIVTCIMYYVLCMVLFSIMFGRIFGPKYSIMFGRMFGPKYN